MPKHIALTVALVPLVDQHAMQDSTTTTVKDILHTIVQAIITITIVDGGGGIGDVVQ